MLVNFEKRYFENEINVWQGLYCDLQNIVHWHREYEMIYIKKGSAKIGVNQNTYTAKTGDLVICKGGDMHRITSIEAGTVCGIIIFDGDFLRTIFHKLSLASPYIKSEQIIENNLHVERLFNSISNELKQENIFAEKVIEAYLTDFFVMCMRRLKYIETSFNRKTQKQILIQAYQDLLEYIDANYAEADFEKAAKLMSFTPQHFSKVFKEISGMTFTDYLNYVRIEKAVYFIQTTNMSITAVAQRCGFKNIRSFNRIFKNITGATPSGINLNYQMSMNLHPFKNTKDPFDATISHSNLIVK